MDSLYKLIVRRKSIVLMVFIFVTFILYSTAPPKEEKSAQKQSVSPKTASSSPLVDQVSTNSHEELVTTNSPICHNCSLNVHLPRLPKAVKKFQLHLNGTSNLQQALSIIYSNHLPFILVEPCILWQILTPSEQDDLITRKSSTNLTVSCDKLKSQENIFTFILLEKYNHSTWQSVEQFFKDNDFQVELIRPHKTLAHVVLKRDSLTLHIALVKERGHMHMVPSAMVAANGNNSLIKREHLRLGDLERAFERITSLPIQVNSMYIIIPKEYQRFLFELPHSRFVECRHDLAKKWRNKFALTKEAEEKLNVTITMMRHLIFDVHLPIWMDGGSLLGWARHCSAIVHERDADFASWADIHANRYNLTNSIIKSLHSPWYVIETFGLPWAAYEMRIFNVKLNWQVDLFFMTQDEQDAHSYYSGYHTFPAVSYYKVYYEKQFFQNICSGEIYGQKILVPCAYDDVLKSEYGDKWVIPDTHHFLKSQPRTHRSSWQLHEAPYAYQCLGRYQFDVREMKYSDYKYNSTIHEKDTTMAQPVQDILDHFKKTCDHFRWDRTS